jgi:hypothetical protein
MYCTPPATSLFCRICIASREVAWAITLCQPPADPADQVTQQ